MLIVWGVWDTTGNNQGITLGPVLRSYLWYVLPGIEPGLAVFKADTLPHCDIASAPQDFIM